jgi:hypothetical protein
MAMTDKDDFPAKCLSLHAECGQEKYKLSPVDTRAFDDRPNGKMTFHTSIIHSHSPKK